MDKYGDWPWSQERQRAYEAGREAFHDGTLAPDWVQGQEDLEEIYEMGYSLEEQGGPNAAE